MIAERRFTLEPLCEIAPKLIEPRSGKSIQELLKDCKDPLRVKILELS
jgi:2-amino-4-hydroxy-6-hydroxymethyldihydropteridine diphosphokinase